MRTKPLCLALLTCVALAGCARCESGHYETQTREHCEMKPQLMLTLSNGYQYVWIRDCNGTDTYDTFICDKYEPSK